MSQTLEIKLRNDWDSTLTYDSLDAPEKNDGAIFVGRQDLLGPITTAVAQPEQRGTYLISGYRGAGKTSLLIQALRQAIPKLPDGWRLLPLVLNVSEVSASLLSDSDQKVVHPVTAHAISIDARRLLIALLRAINHRLHHPPAGSTLATQEIIAKVSQIYLKATAAEYRQGITESRDETRKQTRELSFELKSNLLKVLGGFSILAAVAVEVVAWWGPAVNILHVIAGTLFSASGLSLYASRRTTIAKSQSSGQDILYRYDNSLHQLETDLKDILTGLHNCKLRLVVALEELDKIDDVEGTQLGAVIRYFKNLFTQAPALFFFVTDKGYFDTVSARIRKARRKRSYAVEHTFFTHRVFVGRPSTQDCLDYLKAIIDNQQLANELKSSGQLGAPSLPVGRFGEFVRILLFRSSNHLFDLKNDLRRFLRTDMTSSPTLVIDDRSLAEEEAALAKFLDLIEEKRRSFSFTGGLSYANEVLRDCLSSVFVDLDGNLPQDITHFYPAWKEEQDGTVLSGEEQLDLAEENRIRAAVNSLVEDLHRGGAFDATGTNIEKGVFTWRAGAARAFQFVRRLERHEADFAAQLKTLTQSVVPFASGGRLVGMPGIALEQADHLVDRLNNREQTLRDTRETVPVELALKEQQQFENEVRAITAAAYTEQLRRLEQRYGIRLYLIGTSSQGGGLYALEGSTSLGAVLVAQGESDRLKDDFREYVTSSPSIQRIALIHIIHSSENSAKLEFWRGEWAQLMVGLHESRSSELMIVPLILSLDEGLEQDFNTWGDRLADEIIFRSYWIRHSGARDESDAFYKWSWGDQTVPGETDRLDRLIEQWVNLDAQLLCVRIQSDAPGIVPLNGLREIEKAFGSPNFRDVAFFQLDSPSGVLDDNQKALSEIGWRVMKSARGPKIPYSQNNLELAARVAKRLISSGRLLVGLPIDPTGGSEWQISEKQSSALRTILDKSGRAIIVGLSNMSLPSPLDSLKRTEIIGAFMGADSKTIRK